MNWLVFAISRSVPSSGAYSRSVISSFGSFGNVQINQSAPGWNPKGAGSLARFGFERTLRRTIVVYNPELAARAIQDLRVPRARHQLVDFLIRIDNPAGLLPEHADDPRLAVFAFAEKNRAISPDAEPAAHGVFGDPMDFTRTRVYQRRFLQRRPVEEHKAAVVGRE